MRLRIIKTCLILTILIGAACVYVLTRPPRSNTYEEGRTKSLNAKIVDNIRSGK